MIARARPIGSRPLRGDGQHTRQTVEAPFVGDQRPVPGAPPIAREETRHHAVAAAAVPDEHSARTDDPGELADHPPIIGRIEEEAERREQIEHGIEAAGPARRQPAHVAFRVAQRLSVTTLFRAVEQRLGVVQAIDVEPGFREQVCMAALPARHIEDPRSDRQLEQLQQPRDIPPILLRREQRLVLQEIVGVEVRRPPFRGSAQKNTGSRYAPNTSSIARRIS